MKQDVQDGIGIVDITVTDDMVAHLDGHVLHRVYGTFWACYHAEVAARRAIEPYFDEGEDAVGSALSITHHGMAGIGARLRAEARVISVHGRRILCRVELRDADRLIAEGTQEQVVLPADVIKRKVAEANHHAP